MTLKELKNIVERTIKSLNEREAEGGVRGGASITPQGGNPEMRAGVTITCCEESVPPGSPGYPQTVMFSVPNASVTCSDINIMNPYPSTSNPPVIWKSTISKVSNIISEFVFDFTCIPFAKVPAVE